VLRVLAAVLVILSAPGRAAAAETVHYRVFLRDGSTVVSYGEFARVGNRVIVSVPIGGGTQPELQLVSIPEASVDWPLTDQYAEAARAQHYARTKGEDDFNLLSNDVARALNEVALTDDPAKRVALADAARKQLLEWPASHFGYRASDVSQLSMLLDDVVSELRVAAGQSQFDLKLVAPMIAPPAVELKPAPTLRESIELAFTAAGHAAEPAERTSLLESISRTLAAVGTDETIGTNGGAPADTAWAAGAKVRAAAELAIEQKVDRAYAQLASRTLSRAAQRARRADVRALDSIIREVLSEDAKMGKARPAEVAALLVAVDAQKDAAQRLRLALDAWTMRAGAFRTYRRQLSKPLDRLTRLKGWLEDVRHLAGPAPGSVNQLEQRAAVAARELALIRPPKELEAVHALLRSASGLAERAATTRRKAIASGDMPEAWEAASAASGALMMLERAVQDLQRSIARPQLR
jgi:hypothetical protein